MLELSPITPSTSSSWTTESTESVYQAHYCADLIMGYFSGIFSTLGIDLGTLHVASNCGNQGAIWYGYSNDNNTYVAFGKKTSGNGQTFATFDVMGHEIGHAIISKFINIGQLEGGSLHEGLADLFGIFAEYQFWGTVNWEMGNEIPFTPVGRDLANIPPDRDCFDDVDHLTISNSSNKHFRAGPLRRLIYLMAEGDSGLGIPGLGIEKTLELFLEALQGVGDEADYKDLHEAMIKVIETNFEKCSDEAVAVFRSWCEICVGPSYFCNYSCDLVLTGQTFWCEENHYLQVCYSGATPGVTPPVQWGKWTIVFRDGLYWVSATGAQSGNTVVGTGTCLTISQFPKYPYYPQEGYIKFSGTVSGQYQTLRKRVVLLDCNNDDPTCEEYYNVAGLQSNDGLVDQYDQSAVNLREKKEVALYRVYDIQGRLILEHAGESFSSERLPEDCYGKILLIYSFSDDGQLISSSKTIILN